MKLPCGCIMTVEGKVFLMKPCSLQCENYLYALEQAEEHGSEIMFINVKEMKK